MFACAFLNRKKKISHSADFFSASAGIKVRTYRLLPEERKAYFLESVNAGTLGPLRKEAAQ